MADNKTTSEFYLDSAFKSALSGHLVMTLLRTVKRGLTKNNINAYNPNATSPVGCGRLAFLLLTLPTLCKCTQLTQILKRLICLITVGLSSFCALAQTPGVSEQTYSYPIDKTPWEQRTREEKVFNSTYEDNNTFKHKEIYDVDPFQWIYTEAFADKFRMPRAGIDNNLKGALALAWRMTSMGKNTCGYARNPESCWPSLTCQLDVYFDSNTPLPWNYTDVVRDNMIEGITSDSYLPRLQPNSKWWRYIRGGQLPSAKGPVLPESLLQMRYLQGGAMNSFLRLWLFDREYEPGIVLLSYKNACPVYEGDGPGVILYHSQAEITRTRGVNPPSVHAVEIPEAFIKKIRATYLVQNKPNQAVTQRLYEDFLRAKGANTSEVNSSK